MEKTETRSLAQGQQTTGRSVVSAPTVPAGHCREDLERVIQSRVEAAIGNSLEDNQYGFRKGRSTIDAINQVVNTSKVAIAGTWWKGGTKEYCLLAVLDVRKRSAQADETL
uniref:Reverse transcriptase domain-containing protein n=1 Tax=Bracon brevicornis TaxID=1563983 RepID=A0A6V7JM82_9HYME